MPEPDDFDAVRKIVEALTPFETKDQERIVRWACEKVGLAQAPDHQASSALLPQGRGAAVDSDSDRPRDIRSFIESKDPTSENQFAATVAYFLRFELPEADQKLSVNANDLNDAARLAGRPRLKNPGQTLLNAHGQGYFDKADRGQYTLNTVGENLVAIALPQSAGVPRGTSGVKTKRPPAKSVKKSAGRKKR